MGENASDLIPQSIAKIMRPQKETGQVKVSRLIKLGRLVEQSKQSNITRFLEKRVIRNEGSV
jgi:hypothetical protein